MSQQQEIGTLVVVVLKAQHLHQPSFYKQDPYVQVSLSGLKKRTKVDPKGGQHPVWDDELRFPVLADSGKDKANRILEVFCYKDEQRGDDVLLGRGTVDIEETLRIGEFDDWVPLETLAGARGEVYLEMTFYANSPPPLTRRPSKLSPFDRVARPVAYFTQGRQSTPSSTSPSPQPLAGRSPVGGERNLLDQPSSTGVSEIPSSLIPAHGPQSQPSRQAPSNGGATSVIAAKHKNDSLPPLPIHNEPSDVDTGRNLGLPAALHPGGRSGPRPMPLQNRNRVTSAGHPSLETLPDQLHRRTPSDAPALAPPLAVPQPQIPMQTSPEITSVMGMRNGSTPSIVVERQAKDHPPPACSTPFASSPGSMRESEPRAVHGPEIYDSSAYGPPRQVYMQPALQGYIPSLPESPQTFAPSQRPMPVQSPRIPSGQLQQLYDTSPAVTSPSSLHQEFSRYSGGTLTLHHLSPSQVYPQLHSIQPQQQGAYPSQLHQYSPRQQSYLPQQQQQYLPQPQQQWYYPEHPPYTQTPHPPNVPYPYKQDTHLGLAPNSQSPIVSQQRPLSSHTVSPPLLSMASPHLHPQPQQSYLAVPPPPPLVQSRDPQPYAPQPNHHPQSSFSPTTPPPPPPPLCSQGGKAPPQVSVAQPSQMPEPSSPSNRGIPPSTPLPQSATLGTSLLQPPPTSPSQIASSTTPAASTEVIRQGQVEKVLNAIQPVTVLGEAGTVLQEEVSETLEDMGRGQVSEEQSEKFVKEGQLEQLKDPRGEGTPKEIDCSQRMERQRCEELQRQEELKRQEEEQPQEVERRRKEAEEHRRREEERKRREEEELRREEERREREEVERRRQEQEELRRLEEEHRKEADRKKLEEEERRKRDEERRRQEEEQNQCEREEAERRRKAAEEKARRRRAEEEEAERRWQGELIRIRARAEQEAADAAFAHAQMEAEEAERQRQEEANLTLVRQAQEEAEREKRLVRERRRQEEIDMEVAKREQAHEEELERRRREETRQRVEEADRELARRLDMELNLGM